MFSLSILYSKAPKYYTVIQSNLFITDIWYNDKIRYNDHLNATIP